jgi:methylmalonyl-CoA mutase
VSWAGAPLERLVSRTAEGLRVEALHPASRPSCRARAAARARGLDDLRECSEPDAAAAGLAIAEDLGRGAQAVWVRLDEPAPVGLHGVVVRDADDLGKDCSRGRPDADAGDAGGRRRGPAMRAMLTRVLAARGLELAGLRGLLGCDPLGALARRGGDRGSIEQGLSDMSEVAGWARAAAPGLRTALVDVGRITTPARPRPTSSRRCSRPGSRTLRALTAGGASVVEATRQMSFAVAVGRDLFLEIAKLRAARLCWARVVAACGGDASAQRMHLHARGLVARAHDDRPVGRAAARHRGRPSRPRSAGADSIATTPMDAALGEPGALGRRLALNTQIILAEESHLGRVADPGGGAGPDRVVDRPARARGRGAGSSASRRPAAWRPRCAAGSCRRRSRRPRRCRRRRSPACACRSSGSVASPRRMSGRPARGP